jgi:hypothetical protein
LESIWIFQADPLRSVKRRFRFADCHALAAKQFAHLFYVGALEKQLSVSMSSDSSGVRRGGPFPSVIRGIEHQFGSAESEPHPIKFAISRAPVFDNFKSKRAIEGD